MRRVFIVVLVLLSVGLTTAKAAGWDARTTRTNTSVTDGDIQLALTIMRVAGTPDDETYLKGESGGSRAR